MIIFDLNSLLLIGHFYAMISAWANEGYSVNVLTFLLDKFDNHLFMPISWASGASKERVCNTLAKQHLKKDLHLSLRMTFHLVYVWLTYCSAKTLCRQAFWTDYSTNLKVIIEHLWTQCAFQEKCCWLCLCAQVIP